MSTAFTVYSKKPLITVRQFADAARNVGLELRFMGLGGYGFHFEQSDKAYYDSPLDGILLIGAFDSDKANLDQFDAAAKKGDSQFVRVMLHTDTLPWCELYAREFCYDDSDTSYKKTIDSWTPKEDRPFVIAAKTRYLIHNHSRRKTGQRLTEQAALILRKLSNGVVTEFASKANKSAAKKPQFKTIVTKSLPK
jgi:hypothetical protein